MQDQIDQHIDRLLSYMKEEAYKPLTVQELEEALEIEDSADFKNFVKALVKMEEKGLVVRTRSNRYGLPQKMNLIRGKLTGHAKGFAFVTPEDEPGAMIFSSRRQRQKMRCMAISSWFVSLQKQVAQDEKVQLFEF